ncbi:Acg family FMN-binding oxidoreductase [Nocardia sp. MW-W600-9]
MATATRPDIATVRAVFERASRAPSLHNAQPWRWRWDGTAAALFVDADRLLPATDMFNREGVLGCGVMLHHAEVAWAAAGWETRVVRFPEPSVRAHVASLEPVRYRAPAEPQLSLGEAVDRRYSDRMPMDAPQGWAVTKDVLDFLTRRSGVTATFLDPVESVALQGISELTTRFRRYDPKYQAELSWWTAGPEPAGTGVPAAALPSLPDRAHVPVGREFPSGTAESADGVDDAAMVAVLSTTGDSAADLLDCGSALSAVLLECTVQHLSTCTVSHVVEIPAARARLADLVGQAYPQVLVRIGTARSDRPPGTSTPRRSIDSILQIQKY